MKSWGDKVRNFKIKNKPGLHRHCYGKTRVVLSIENDKGWYTNSSERYKKDFLVTFYRL